MAPPFHNCGISHVPVTGQLYACPRKPVHGLTVSNLRLMNLIILPKYRDSPNPQTSSVVRSDGMKIPWFDSREAGAIVQIDLRSVISVRSHPYARANRIPPPDQETH